MKFDFRELYANREKRENGFDPSGAVRTTRKMVTINFNSLSSSFAFVSFSDFNRFLPII